MQELDWSSELVLLILHHRNNELRRVLTVDLEFSVRTRNVLKKMNLVTVFELANKTEDEMLNCKHCGMTNLKEMRAALEKLGTSFRKRE
jgi:DNA-directed RNA polymerase alpha subunit